MNTIIIYTSATGFTKKYAEWIAERTGYEAVTLKDAKKMDLSTYERIVYGGWIHAAIIAGINDVIKLAQNKKLLLFAVGGAPVNDDTIKNLHNALPENLKDVELIYCPGGFNYENMGFGSKTMMKMFSAMLSSKKDKTPDEEEMARMIKTSYDISDPKYIEELVVKLQGAVK